MREVETKFKVDNLDGLAEKLSARGCMLSAPINQHDVFYSKDGVDLWESSKTGDNIMRLRNQDGVHQFNLKQQKTSELDNLEYETEVSDPDAIHNILQILGWTRDQNVEVEKVRRKGKIDGYEVCLDDIEGLGTFMELEELADDDADPGPIQEKMTALAESLGISRDNLEVRGYDTMLYQKNKKGE